MLRIKTMTRVSGCIAGALLLTATSLPAHASSSRTLFYQGSVRGSASFDSHGEIAKVKDLRRDGRPIVFEAYWDDDFAQCVVTSGSGTSKTCNWSIPEGKKVTLVLSASLGGEELAASVTWTDRA